MTNRSFLRSISRVDAYHTNAGHDCFVVDKLPELTETPRAMSMSLGTGLDRCPLSNALEVFQNNQGRGAFGFHDKFLGDAMVGVSSKPCFMTGKLLEMLFSAVGTTTLQRCSEIIEFDSSLVDLFTGEGFSCGIRCDVLDSEIYANDIDGHDRSRFGSLDHNTKKELIVPEDQICLTSDPIQSLSMIITDLNRNYDPAPNSQQRDSIKPLPGHDPIVIDKRAIGIKCRFDGRIPFIGFACFGNCPDRHLRGYAILFTDIMINKRLQLDFIGGLHLKSNFCYIITRCIELMHGLKESLGLLWFNCNFDFESLHHDSIDIFCLWHKYLTYGGAQFLRTLKDAASLGDEVNNY
jgi:hypothetical protein